MKMKNAYEAIKNCTHMRLILFYEIIVRID